MLDTFRGLPVHVLLLHATVVLVPLTCVVTTAVAFWPRVRAVGAWPVVGLNVVTVVLVWLTAMAGARLEARIGVTPRVAHHAALGLQLRWFAVALLVTSVLVALVRTHKGGPVRLGAGVVSAVVAIATLVWVVRVGESGATAVWKDIIANTTAGG